MRFKINLELSGVKMGIRSLFPTIVFFCLFVFACSKACLSAEETDFLNLSGNDDSIRIVFVANSKGLTEPCPICGKRAYGGLAKRATILKKLYSDGIPTLYIAGPYEWRGTSIMDTAKSLRKSDVKPEMWANAQNLFPPSIGYLAEKEADDLKGIGIPKGYLVPHAKPLVKVANVKGYRISVILFPELPNVGDQEDFVVPPHIIEDVARAGRNQMSSDLVIGISPWGVKPESRVLRHLSGVYDLILGAGFGSFLKGELPDFAPGIIWTRSESDGRSLMELRFNSLKSHSRPYGWVKDVDFVVNEHMLGKDVRDYPAMRKILGPAKTHN